MAKHSDSRGVYRTDGGRLCPQCQRLVVACVCGADRPAATGDGVVRIRRETKGRGGKAVTVIDGIPADLGETQEPLQTAQTTLRRGRCGERGPIGNSGGPAGNVSKSALGHGLCGKAVRRLKRSFQARFSARFFSPHTPARRPPKGPLVDSS